MNARTKESRKAGEAAALLKADQDREHARLSEEEAVKVELRSVEDILSAARLGNARLAATLADAKQLAKGLAVEETVRAKVATDIAKAAEKARRKATSQAASRRGASPQVVSAPIRHKSFPPPALP